MTGTWSEWELVVPCTQSCEELWIRACLTGTNCEGKMTEKRVECVGKECPTAGSLDILLRSNRFSRLWFHSLKNIMYTLIQNAQRPQ